MVYARCSRQLMIRTLILLGGLSLLVDSGVFLSTASKAKVRKTHTASYTITEEQWEKLVNKYAERMYIKDKDFAKQVVLALEDSASEFDINPWLIASVIRVESSGNPDAVSPVGAIGLMQIMPETGRHIAKQMKMKDFSEDKLYNPEINIRMGSFYLRQLLDRFKGNKKAAIAAYNWGPGHISRRLANNEPLPVQYPSKVLKFHRSR